VGFFEVRIITPTVGSASAADELPENGTRSVFRLAPSRTNAVGRTGAGFCLAICLASRAVFLLHFHEFDLVFQDTMELAFSVFARRWRRLAVQAPDLARVTYVGLTAMSLLTSAYYLSVPRSLLICSRCPWCSRSGSQRSGGGDARRCSSPSPAACVLRVDTTSLLGNGWAG
jgi:hypothetical protein